MNDPMDELMKLAVDMANMRQQFPPEADDDVVLHFHYIAASCILAKPQEYLKALVLLLHLRESEITLAQMYTMLAGIAESGVFDEPYSA